LRIHTFRDNRLGIEAGELSGWRLLTDAPEETPLGVGTVKLQRSVGLGNLIDVIIKTRNHALWSVHKFCRALNKT
jgi:hypothetical protein